MDHPWFVATAYGISAVVIAGLIVWILLDGRARQRDIAALEASGVRRRSAQGKSGQA
jgi:heme exporter protein D